MSNNLIELQNVCAILGRTQVLDHVNLQLREGEILGLWGDNGSGKSALVSLLAGVHALSQGQILLDGVRATESMLSAESGCKRRLLGSKFCSRTLARKSRMDVSRAGSCH